MNVYSLTKFLSVASAAALAFYFLAAVPVVASTTNTVTVGTGGLVFNPVTNNLNADDAIIWVWGGAGHSTTSDTNGIWDSGIFSAPHSFTNSFPTAGTFPFHCTVHGGAPFFMRGVVIVSASANVPPTVTITNPASGTVLSAPANVTIGASATDSDGSVAGVQFFVDTTLVTNCPTAPFFGVANNLAAGSYTVTAIATDDLGATGTNTVSVSVVTPVAMGLSQPQIAAGTNFQFSYSANVGLSYVVLRATNLVSPSWIPLLTNKAASSPVTFVETNAQANPAFYRVGLQPNP